MASLYDEIVAEAKLRKAKRNSLWHKTGILLLCVLLIGAIGASALTYAWISRNRNVYQKNVNMRYDADSLMIGGVSIDDGVVTIVDPGITQSTSSGDDNMIPGSILAMRIGLVNSSQEGQVVTSVGFQETLIWTPSDGSYDSIAEDDWDEIPSLVDDSYYYLGTQLTVYTNRYTIYEYEDRQVVKNGVPQFDKNGQPITEMVVVDAHDPVTLSSMTPIVMTTVNGSTVTYAETIRSDLNAELPVHHLIAFDIVVTFVDAPNEQNAYRDFGMDLAKFSRTVQIGVAD